MNINKTINPILVFITLFVQVSFASSQSGDDKLKQLYFDLNNAKSDSARINGMIYLSQYYRTSKIDSAFVYAKMAYNLSKVTHCKQMESAYTLGVAYDLFNDFVSAKNLYIEAYNEAKKTGNRELLCAVYNAIGNNYALLGEFEMALEYFKKTLEMNLDTQSDYQGFFNMGQAFIYLDRFEEAEIYLNKALEIARDANSIYDIANIYCCFGELYFRTGEYEKSLDFFNKVSELGISDESNISLTANISIARSYRYMGNFNKAIQINLLIDSVARKTKLVQEQNNACYELSKLYDTIGKPSLALKYYKIHSILNDSIYQRNKADQINFLNIKFETAQKEQKIEALNKETKFRRILNYVYLIIGCLVVLISFFIIRSFRQRNQILALEKEKLEQQKEREIIKKKKLELELFEKDREILMHVMQINQQKEVLTDVQIELNTIIQRGEPVMVYNSVKQLNSNIASKINLSDDWDQIKLHFEKVHPGFFVQLKTEYSDLTVNELKLCAYTKLKFSIKEISRLLNINPTSVQVSRYRLKKKMQIPENINFDDFIHIR